MLLTANGLDDDPVDICIVGGGAAGLTLAARLADTGRRVLLLEAGGRDQTATSQSFYVGEVADPAVHWPLDTYRVRALGGTSRLWGGRVIPYDPIDFEARPWVPHSGWPIGHDTVAHYYPAALDAAEAGEFDYAPSGPIVPGLENEWLHTTVERFSRPTDFWARYGARLTAAANVRVVTDAAVAAIRLAERGDHVDHLEVRVGDTVRRVRAHRYVLAMGGLETARLLLASDDVLPAGIGNAGGWLGRGYMCHLAATFGEVTFTGSPRAIGFDYERDAQGVYLRRRIALTEQAQRELGLLNFTARLHIFDAQDPAHGDAVLSTIFLAAFAIKYEYSRAMREADRSTGLYLRHLANIARDPLRLVHFARTWGVRRYLAARRIPSIALYSKRGRYPLEFHSEQAPNRDSRVTLAEARDAHGMRRLRVDWRVTPLDLTTVRESYRLLGRELERSGTGRLTFDEAGLEAAVFKAGAYGGHHSGTARMAASPADGVVDADCRVHGTDNLFVASTAVLPTSSQANPTLTMLALALRLADHLDALPAPAPAAVTGARTVLVTGAGGFVGRAVVRRLAVDGWSVRAGTRGGVPVAGAAAAVRCDVLDSASLDAAMRGVAAVVHCAVGAPGDTRTIVEGTRAVLAAVQARGVAHVVNLSSVAVYGDVSGLVGEDASTAAAHGDYGRAKVDAEALCRAAAGQGLAVTVLRPSLIWGPGSAQWTTLYAERLRSGGWHALGPAGEGTANLIHVDDLAGFIAHLLARPAPTQLAVFNVDGADPPTWNAYLDALGRALRLPAPLPPRRATGLARAARQAVRAADKMALERVFRGWTPAPWRAARRFASNIPSRDEVVRFATRVQYDIARMREAGYEPRIDLETGLAALARDEAMRQEGAQR